MDRERAGMMVTVVLIIAGIVSRLLEPFSYGDFDETIYAQTIQLWLKGVPLYQEIFYSQGPLFLILLAPFARLPGPSLEVMQLGVTAWGALGMIASAVLGYRLAGSWGSAVSTAVVAASPLLTHLDSHAVAEGPAVALATLSLAIAWSVQGSAAHSALAGALFGASLAVKAFMPVAAVPLLWRLVTSGSTLRSRGVQITALGLGAMLTLCVTILPFDIRAVWDQLVGYRLEARSAANAAPGTFLHEIVRGLRDDLGAVAAALIGTIVLLRTSRAMALMLITWLIGTLVLLTLHHPLFPRHSAALLPPLALLASCAGLSAQGRKESRFAVLLPVIVMGLAIGLSIPGQMRRWSESEGIGDVDEAATALASAAGPDEYVLTDMPAIALRAERLIVPSMVDLSGVRLNTGRVTAESAAIETDQYRPSAILFWLGRLDNGPLESYPASIQDQYSQVWQNRPGQSLWIREDAPILDPNGIPGLLELDDATFARKISARAVSYSGQVRSGDTWRLRVLWELRGPAADVETVHLELWANDEGIVTATMLPFSPQKPVVLWPSQARRMVQYEIPVPAGMRPTRVTPRLGLMDHARSPIAVSSDAQESSVFTLALPQIQILRGSST